MGRGRVEQVQIEFKERLFKMNVTAVTCVLALLFAAANARYIGAGASGQCNEIQFFPKCSSDQFIMNMMQCNRAIQSGYPYQSKGQCVSNADQWISCMQSKSAMCMSSNCPSILGSILGGMDQFMPVFNSFQGVSSLGQVYQTLDGVIDQVFTLFNINLPGQLDVIKQSGIKNWPVPLPGVNGLTIDQLLTDMICPDPGVMPDSIQNILLSVESSWQLLSAMGYPDTSAYVPFCDGDFTQYIVNNLLQQAKAFYAATSRSEWCSVQTSLYEMGTNVLNNKCSFDRLATIFSQVGVPDALIAMFKDSPQLILYTSGCSDTYQPSTYQSQPQYSSNSQSSYPSQYSSNYQQSSYPSQYSSSNQQYQSGGYQSNYQSQYATGNNYNALEIFFKDFSEALICSETHSEEFLETHFLTHLETSSLASLETLFKIFSEALIDPTTSQVTKANTNPTTSNTHPMVTKVSTHLTINNTHPVVTNNPITKVNMHQQTTTIT